VEGVVPAILHGYDVGITARTGEILRVLRDKDEAYWVALLRQFFVDAPATVLRFVPSPALADENTAASKAAVAASVAALGPEGLAACAARIDEAKAEHDAPLSAELQAQLPSEPAFDQVLPYPVNAAVAVYSVVGAFFFFVVLFFFGVGLKLKIPIL
jgi:Zn-dependent M16 (insulinase) family peptidase